MLEELQAALDGSGLKGRIVKRFVEKHGHAYQVGLAELEDGRKVVVKVKRTGRDAFGKAYTREAEYRNLLLLRRLGDGRIPEPLYHADGVLVMSFVEGETLREAGSAAREEAYIELGRLYRRINDLPPDEPERFLRFPDMRSFLTHEFELLYAERLATERIPLAFYDRTKAALLDHEAMRRPADVGLIAKDACGAENILIKDGRLSGLIDFEDLLIGPRMIQFRIDLDEKARAALRAGYGEDAYDRNWDPAQEAAFRMISALRALYNALHEDPVDGAWIEKIRERYRQCAATLGSAPDLPSLD